MSQMSGAVEKAWTMIFPSELECRNLISNSQFLVHYTDYAREILAANELRLRNAGKMSDQSEIRIGRTCVDLFLETNAQTLSEALDSIYSRLYVELVDTWQSEKEAQIHNSFIACFTTQSSDNSMGSEYHWKHHGKVALCLDPTFLKDEPSQLSLYLVKVTYGETAVMTGLNKLLNILQTQRNLFQAVPRDILLSFLRHKLFFVSVASKLDGFSNEREWRLVHAPFLFASADVISGQRVYQNGLEEVYLLKMETPSGSNLSSLATPSLVRKVLIHPEIKGSAPDIQRDIVAQLRYHGAEDARYRVRIVENSPPSEIQD